MFAGSFEEVPGVIETLVKFVRDVG
jgi:hypothetical protein